MPCDHRAEGLDIALSRVDKSPAVKEEREATKIRKEDKEAVIFGGDEGDEHYLPSWFSL